MNARPFQSLWVGGRLDVADWIEMGNWIWDSGSISDWGGCSKSELARSWHKLYTAGWACRLNVVQAD